MTGFGRSEAPLLGRRIVAELRSVNHRFLEVKMRLGREDGELEAELGKLVRSKLERGAVSLFLREENDDSDGTDGQAAARGLIDEDRARLWLAALSQLKSNLQLAGEVTVQMVTSQSGVVRTRAAETPRADYVGAARLAVAASIDALIANRAREGEELARELAGRVDTLVRFRGEIAGLAESEPKAHAERLRARLDTLLQGRAGVAAIDPQRLAQEVALLAERLDVTEELVRLDAHLDEARRLLGGNVPAGRRLDFLLQELLREINTIGSKSQSTEITKRVIDMKAELERFREQAANVE